MIQRKALENLRKWRESKYRKPLVLRGARQVGKTTLVREFVKEHGVHLELNLENEKDRQVFETGNDMHKTSATVLTLKKVLEKQKFNYV
ncbi:MAG: AAA family ATPase [Dysgonamonadaceae bacterium]|jgi:predicted AAA+ superfamily ATPase|nr:AAA family ATPase [Dysgonamonadaceae bacterium]